MALTFSTTSYFEVCPPTAIGGGLRLYTGAFSFAGTNPTATFVVPVQNIVEVRVSGTPTRNIDTTPDVFVVNNSRNSSGYLTTLSTSNSSLDPVISITRVGTSDQDASFTIISKG